MNLFLLIVFLLLEGNLYSQTTEYYFKYDNRNEVYKRVSKTDKWTTKRIVKYNGSSQSNYPTYGKTTSLSSPSVYLPYIIEDYEDGEQVIKFYVDKYNFTEMQGNPIECGINNGICFWYVSNRLFLKAYYRNGKIIGRIYDNEKLGCLDGNCENGKGAYYYTDGSFYIGSMYNNQRHGYGTYYFKNGEKFSGDFSNNELIKNNIRSNASASSSNTTSGIVVAGALLYGAYKLFTKSESKNNSTNPSKPTYSDYSPKSSNNVEIINYYTFGALAVEHAQIEIRNKNNYDVVVSIELKQNDVWNPCHLYSGTGKTEMNGYSYNEDFKESFKVKANSIRLVGLRSNESGRPVDVRIKSVQ